QLLVPSQGRGGHATLSNLIWNRHQFPCVVATRHLGGEKQFVVFTGKQRTKKNYQQNSIEQMPETPHIWTLLSIDLRYYAQV
ncbi:MAG: hypothetical protein L3J82_05280, partial [Planctomycetes bacterium]|nr:hypothetical protein [Planctomycetota bacterium]